MWDPSERKSRKKAQKLGETSVSRPPVPLVSSFSPSKSLPSDFPSLHLWQLSSSLPQCYPIYTHSELTTSTTNPFETPTSNSQSPPFKNSISPPQLCPYLKLNCSMNPYHHPSQHPHPHLTILSPLVLTHLTHNSLLSLNSRLAPSPPKANLNQKPIFLHHLNNHQHLHLNHT